jgi:hypothetical protein
MLTLALASFAGCATGYTKEQCFQEHGDLAKALAQELQRRDHGLQMKVEAVRNMLTMDDAEKTEFIRWLTH